MSSQEIDAMLDNLDAIKQGKDPRADSQPTQPDDSLTVAQNEVDRLFEEHDQLQEYLDRSDITVGVSRNDGRNGVCKYNKRLTKRRFNKKITGVERAFGHVSIVINEKILEDGNRDGFIDTVRHELAHALAWKLYDEYPSRQKHHNYDARFKSHGKAWKKVASSLGADPSSCHDRRDRSNEFKYYIVCSNCGTEGGRTKRCKVIKQPFQRKCGSCGHSPLSSYEAGQEPPEEDGVVAVESIPWDNQSEYWNHQQT